MFLSKIEKKVNIFRRKFALKPCSLILAKVKQKFKNLEIWVISTQTGVEYMQDCLSMQYNPLKCELRPSEKAKLNFCGKLLHKMEDLNTMTQKSISINFGMNFIIVK